MSAPATTPTITLLWHHSTYGAGNALYRLHNELVAHMPGTDPAHVLLPRFVYSVNCYLPRGIDWCPDSAEVRGPLEALDVDVRAAFNQAWDRAAGAYMEAWFAGNLSRPAPSAFAPPPGHEPPPF